MVPQPRPGSVPQSGPPEHLEGHRVAIRTLVSLFTSNSAFFFVCLFKWGHVVQCMHKGG